MCTDCQRRAVTNPLRVFDCKVPEDQPIINTLPTISQFLDEDCRAHYEGVKQILDLSRSPTSKTHAWCVVWITTRALLLNLRMAAWGRKMRFLAGDDTTDCRKRSAGRRLRGLDLPSEKIGWCFLCRRLRSQSFASPTST